MNHQPHDRSDDEFLAHLTQVTNQIEPDPTFKSQLEAELRQAHPANRKTHSLTHPIRTFKRRPTVVVFASLAIATACIVPITASRPLPEWMNAALGKKVNAQTLAQIMSEHQIKLRSDSIEEESSTGNVKGIGNAYFEFPEAEVRGKADEILFLQERQEFVLTGNVELLQNGKPLQGQKVTCAIAQKQCRLTEALKK